MNKNSFTFKTDNWHTRKFDTVEIDPELWDGDTHAARCLEDGEHVFTAFRASKSEADRVGRNWIKTGNAS